MPNIIFASNNLSHFPTALSSSNVLHFDANRVPYSIALSNDETVTSPVFVPVQGDHTWFHFRTYLDDQDYHTSGKPDMIEAYDDQNRKIFSVRKVSGTNMLLPRLSIFDGDVSITQDGTIPLTLQKINSVDIHLTVHALQIKADVYINTTLSASLQFNTNTNNIGKPVRFALGSSFPKDFVGIQYYSEIIVADADTRNARLNLLRPTAAGTLNEWDGPIAHLADEDTTTGMTTTTGGIRQTFQLSDYSAANNISNVVCITSTTRGVNSPTAIRHFVRSGAVNYDHPTIHGVGFPLEYQVSDFKINPATSLPWVASDLELMEMGFLSVT